MTLKSLRKLVETASDQKGGWESYRAREKAQAELLHYMPLLLKVAELAKATTKGHEKAREQMIGAYYSVPNTDMHELMDALTALEGK
jgi:hypothetical protein